EMITPLQRLSIVGESGLGALEYKPIYNMRSSAGADDLDYLAAECSKILSSEDSGDLDELFALGGSSGGARPKVMMNLDGEEWIIKFPSSADPEDIGLMEYEYNECARSCGIEIPETRLFTSKKCAGYFGSKRFDRVKAGDKLRKIHMASASALLEVSHRVPALDYNSLMALTWQLTKQMSEVESMYRLMCFNVFSHNRDDHSNNFSFLCDNGTWRLSPAYDLTYSNSIGGEHATTVNGEGREPGFDDLIAVGKKAGLKEMRLREITEEVRSEVGNRLSKYIH
ncbi:MAG: HipA domain-containing protein, partial [Mogibacterium sp.]|nr:HipA domain-containing protein [Mogibacterium sp.]